MSAYEIITIFIGILALLISFGSLVIAALCIAFHKAANTTKSSVNISNVFIAISFSSPKRATKELSPYCIY